MRYNIGYTFLFTIKIMVKESAIQSKRNLLVRSPGFEPGSSGWEPDVLAKLDYDRNCF